jgi:carbonic anhydrase/acetyltransferase-like protein (isoleucine patch superfamily)
MLPKPSSIALDPSVLIAQHAQLTGTQPITLGPHTVLHPHSKISSALAPVVLGEGVVVYERAKVGVGMGPELDAESRRSSMASARSSAPVRSEGTVLGRNVVVESNALVEAAEVGEGTVIEVGAVVGRGSVIGKVCAPPSTTCRHRHHRKLTASTVLHHLAVVRCPAQHASARLYRCLQRLRAAHRQNTAAEARHTGREDSDSCKATQHVQEAHPEQRRQVDRLGAVVLRHRRSSAAYLSPCIKINV